MLYDSFSRDDFQIEWAAHKNMASASRLACSGVAIWGLSQVIPGAWHDGLAQAENIFPTAFRVMTDYTPAAVKNHLALLALVPPALNVLEMRRTLLRFAASVPTVRKPRLKHFYHACAYESLWGTAVTFGVPLALHHLYNGRVLAAGGTAIATLGTMYVALKRTHDRIDRGFSGMVPDSGGQSGDTPRKPQRGEKNRDDDFGGGPPLSPA